MKPRNRQCNHLARWAEFLLAHRTYWVFAWNPVFEKMNSKCWNFATKSTLRAVTNHPTRLSNRELNKGIFNQKFFMSVRAPYFVQLATHFRAMTRFGSLLALAKNAVKTDIFDRIKPFSKVWQFEQYIFSFSGTTKLRRFCQIFKSIAPSRRLWAH